MPQIGGIEKGIAAMVARDKDRGELVLVNRIWGMVKQVRGEDEVRLQLSAIGLNVP